MGHSVNNKKMLQRKTKENKSKQYPLLNLYILIISILQIIGEITNIYPLRLLKPIPLILMIIYISYKNSQNGYLIIGLVRIGFVFSLIGDLCLMISQNAAFIVGTLFFLVAHFLYCVAFNVGDKVRESSMKNKSIRLVISCIIIFLCLKNIYDLWDAMPNRVIFTTYGVVLCIMTIFSVKRYQITTPSSYKYILIGAVLFGLSDNLLAFLKFSGISTHLGRGIVMLLYYGGQYMIMHGTVYQSNLSESMNKYYETQGHDSPPPVLVESNNENKKGQD